MSNVTFAIGGRSYTVACAEGEEAHVRSLGQIVDDKVQAIGAASQSEVRQLLFAAIMLADEVHEARGRSGDTKPGALSEDTAERLEAIADKLERLAGSFDDGT
jgi:cell division protein ZapA